MQSVLRDYYFTPVWRRSDRADAPELLVFSAICSITFPRKYLTFRSLVLIILTNELLP